MLSCTSLCNDALFAYSSGKENLINMSALWEKKNELDAKTYLTNCVVDFVGPRMIAKHHAMKRRSRLLLMRLHLQVFALEPDIRATCILCQVFCEVQPRRAVHIAVMAAELFPKLGISHC